MTDPLTQDPLQQTLRLLNKIEFYSDGGIRCFPSEQEVNALESSIKGAAVQIDQLFKIDSQKQRPAFLPGDIVRVKGPEGVSLAVITESLIMVNGDTFYWNENIPKGGTRSYPMYDLDPLPGMLLPRTHHLSADDFLEVVRLGPLQGFINGFVKD